MMILSLKIKLDSTQKVDEIMKPYCSKLNDLKIENTSDDGVTFDKAVYVVGNIYGTSSKIVNGTNLYVSTEAKFTDGTWNGDLHFVEDYTLDKDISVSGNIILTGGTLNLNGHT